MTNYEKRCSKSSSAVITLKLSQLLMSRRSGGSLNTSVGRPINSEANTFASISCTSSRSASSNPSRSWCRWRPCASYLKVLRRSYSRDDIPLPRTPRRQIPIVLSTDEVRRLIDAAPNLRYRTILMTLYDTGMRRAELCQLRPSTSTRSA